MCDVCRIWRLWRLGGGKRWGGVRWGDGKSLSEDDYSLMGSEVMHEAGLRFLFIRDSPTFNENIVSELGPHLTFPDSSFPPSVSLFFLSFSGPVEVVFCHIYTFSQIEKTSRGSVQRECEWLEGLSTPRFASRDSPRRYHLTPLPHAWKRDFSICCLYTGDSLEKHPQKVRKLESPKSHGAMVETILVRLYSLPGHLSDNLTRKQSFHFCASSI